jgi:hypothetical protein
LNIHAFQQAVFGELGPKRGLGQGAGDKQAGPIHREMGEASYAGGQKTRVEFFSFEMLHNRTCLNRLTRKSLDQTGSGYPPNPILPYLKADNRGFPVFVGLLILIPFLRPKGAKLEKREVPSRTRNLKNKENPWLSQMVILENFSCLVKMKPDKSWKILSFHGLTLFIFLRKVSALAEKKETSRVNSGRGAKE